MPYSLGYTPRKKLIGGLALLCGVELARRTDTFTLTKGKLAKASITPASTSQ